MRLPSLAIILALVPALVLVGCTGPGAPPGDGDDDDDDDECVDDAPCASSADASSCGDTVDACGVEVTCPCRDDAATEALMPAVDEALTLLRDRSYMQDVIDLDLLAVRDGAFARVRDTPGDELAVLAGVSFIVRSFKNGHTSIFHTARLCRDLGGADVGVSVWGVCAAPSGDDFVVTHQPGVANPLGLVPGDRIVSRNGKSGSALVDDLLDAPNCSNGVGHEDARRDHAAGVLFSALRAGDALDVVAVADGAARTIEVPDAAVGFAECRFPAGPTRAPWIDAELRDDGVLVVRLRRFILFPGEPGYVDVVTEADALEMIDNMIDEVAAVIAPHLGAATAIVWDARGNIGGASPVGFAIVAGMQGAVDVPIARCTTRIEDTDPIEYFVGGPDYDIDTTDDRLRVAVPAALLIDGFSISAADYFARAVKLATDARIFGRPSAGAYGGGGAGGELANAPELFLSFDPFRCNDIDGTPLETTPTFPDELVDLQPADLAAGRDTVLEAAVTHLLTL